MIDHTGISVSNFEAARLFYRAALAPLGVRIMIELGDSGPFAKGRTAGFGREGDGHATFWIDDHGRQRPHNHTAFAARSRAEVDAFHAAAIAAGGKENGAPGPRGQYGPHYYAAFVIDPEGHNIEAVYRGGDE